MVLSQLIQRTFHPSMTYKLAGLRVAMKRYVIWLQGIHMTMKINRRDY